MKNPLLARRVARFATLFILAFGGCNQESAPSDGLLFGVPLSGGGRAEVTGNTIRYRRASAANAVELETLSVERDGRSKLRRSASARFVRTTASTVAAAGAGFVETVVVRADELEQSWTFDRAPEGERDLVIRVVVRGATFTTESDRGLVFGHGADAVEYRHGTFIDAEGARLPVPARYVDGAIELRVSAATLAAAAYPAVLDPIIGAPAWPVVSPPITWAHDYSGAPHTVSVGSLDYTLYISDPAATNTDAYYLLPIDADGNAIEQAVRVTGVPIDCAGRELFADASELVFFCYHSVSGYWMYRIGFGGTVASSAQLAGITSASAHIARGPNEYIFTWDVALGGDLADIYARRFGPAGESLDAAPIRITNGPRYQRRPQTVYTGTHYLIAYEDDRFTDVPTTDVRVTQLSTAGVVSNLDGDIVSASPTERESNPHLDVADGRILLSFNYFLDNSTSIGWLRVVELGPTGSPIGSIQTLSSARPGTSVWVETWTGSEWLILTHDVGSTAELRLTRWNPVTRDTGFYLVEDTLFTIGRHHLVFRNGRALLVAMRNYNLLGYLLAPTSYLGQKALDTYRRTMVVQDVATNGTVYAVAYYLRAQVGSGNEQAYVAVLGPDGGLVSTHLIDGSSSIATIDTTRRTMTLETMSDGSFSVLSAYSGTVLASVDAYGGLRRTPISASSQNLTGRLSWDGQWLLYFHSGRYVQRVDVRAGTLDSTITITSAAGSKEDIVADAKSGTHLAVWTDGRNSGITGRDIYAIRVANNGMPVDQNALAITNALGDDTRPEVAATASGWLVTWRTAAGDIGARFVSEAGTTPLPATTHSFGAPVTEQVLTFRGARGLLAASVATGNGLMGITLDENGSLVEGPFDLGTVRPATGVGGASALVEDRYLVAYESLDAPSENPQMFVRTVSVRAPLGSMCASSADCDGDPCVDGVCCTTACGGGDPSDCMACSVLGGGRFNGSCAPRALASVCRASAGTCDFAETCNGVSTACPGDARALYGTVCRASAGGCDPAEVCDGASGACPTNQLSGAGVVCRSASGRCDLAEICDGTSAACANDAVAPNGTVCRESTNRCDVADVCDGSAKTCPMDERVPDGTSCDDALACNGRDACDAGECMPGTPMQCPSNDVCRIGICEEPGVCSDAPIYGCCRSSSECNDGNPCTTDFCGGARRCVFAVISGCMSGNATEPPMEESSSAGAPGVNATPLTPDAGADASAGSEDGTVPTPSIGTCGVARPGSARLGAGVVLALALALVLARRRRPFAGALVAGSALACAVVLSFAPADPAAPSSRAARPRAARTTTERAPSFRDIDGLDSLVERAHFAFRAEAPGAFAVSHETYAVRVSNGEISARAHGSGSELRLATRRIARSNGDDSRIEGENVQPDGVLALDRGASVEHVRASEEGVEQSWAFQARPAGGGDLVAELTASGLAFVGTSDSGLHFADASGAGFRYGHATFVDARGRRTAVPATYDGGSIVLRVPAAELDSAAYPAVLDPIIAPEVAIDVPVVARQAASQDDVHLVAGNGQFLIVWTDTRAGVGAEDVYGARIGTDGRVLDPLGFPIAAESGAQRGPAVGFDGTKYLVVYGVGSNSNVLMAKHVSLEGTVLDATPLELLTTGAQKSTIDIEFDGFNYLVLWYEAGLRTLRLTPQGVPIDPIPQLLITSCSSQDLIFDGENFILVCEGSQNGYPHILGMRITRSGTVLDVGGTKLTADRTPSVTKTQPRISCDGTQLLLSWREITNTAYVRRFSRDLIPLEEYPNELGTGTAQRAVTSIVSNGSGFTVLWFDSGVSRMRVSRVLVDGTLVDPAGILLPASLTNAALAAASGTQTLLAWSDTLGGAPDVFSLLLDVSGTPSPFGPMHVSAQTNLTSSPAFASDGSQLFAVWRDNRGSGDIYGSRLTPAGVSLDPAGIGIELGAFPASAPAVVFDGTSFAVWWREAELVKGRRVSRAGFVLDAQPITFPDLGDATGVPALASNGAGYVVVASVTTGPSSSVLAAVRFDAAGIPIDTVPIEIATSAAPFDADVVSDGDGYFVAFSDASGIHGRALPSSGLPIADVFDIAASTSPRAPSVAFGDDVFLVTWNDFSNGAEPDVLGARVASSGALLDEVPLTIANGVGFQGAPSVAFMTDSFLVSYRDASTGSSNVRAARVTMEGAVLDASGFSISQSMDDASTIDVVSIGGTAVITYSRPTSAGEYRTHVHARRVCERTVDVSCDGIDSDCDGNVDEEFARSATVCGIGICASTGHTYCTAGEVADTCTPGVAFATDADCDGEDDDCDGTADDGFPAGPTICGVGACASTGVVSCVSGVALDTCVAGSMVTEVCNGLDDDCDGQADEGLGCMQPDASVADAGSDAGSDAGELDGGGDASEPPPESKGGCAASRGRGTPSWVMLVCLALVTRRRRSVA